MDNILQRPRIKKITVSIIALFILAMGYWLLLKSQTSVKHLDLQYGSSSGQSLDIYSPNIRTTQNLPVIVYVHGGGWTEGSRKDVEFKPSFFVQKGYVFVSVEHRFAPEVTYEKMVEDIALAIKWLYTHAPEYQIDPNRINLMGHSSGAHLILLCGSNPYYLNQVGLSSSFPKSVVSLEAPLNLTRYMTRVNAYREIFGENVAQWEQASPETYAASRNLPPILLVARQAGSAATFAKRAREAGNQTEIYEVKTLTHNQVSGLIGAKEGPAEARDMANAIVDFLNQHNS